MSPLAGLASFDAREAFAFDDFADDPGLMLLGADELQDGVRLLDVDDGDHADAHVEDLVEFFFGDAAALGQQAENGQHVPGALADDDVARFGEDARDVVDETAAGDVGQAVDVLRVASSALKRLINFCTKGP